MRTAEDCGKRQRIAAKSDVVVMIEHRLQRLRIGGKRVRIDPSGRDLAAQYFADQRRNVVPVEPAFGA